MATTANGDQRKQTNKRSRKQTVHNDNATATATDAHRPTVYFTGCFMAEWR